MCLAIANEDTKVDRTGYILIFCNGILIYYCIFCHVVLVKLLYIKDFYACDPEAKPMAIKKIANQLVTEGELMFWSSGSTTMYARPDRIQNEEK